MLRGMNGTVALAAVWWCSRYRKVTTTIDRKWKTSREVIMNGLEVTLHECFVDTNHGSAKTTL